MKYDKKGKNIHTIRQLCVVSKRLKVLFEIVLNNSDSGVGGEGGVYVGKYNLKHTIKVQY